MTHPPASAFDDLPERPVVLLVDDDEVSLLLTAIALRERGFDMQEASSGQRALELLSSRVPDVVVLDAMMPGLDGFDTCRALRRMPGCENVPVLMLTGLDDDASIARAYDAGATDFFVKASQWSLLAGRLRYLLRSARTRIELERRKSELARAQDLARMGSFEWRRHDKSGARCCARCMPACGRARCWRWTCPWFCATDDSVSCVWKPNPSSTSTARVPATPASCRT
jgi:PleD family two-component response regulator